MKSGWRILNSSTQTGKACRRRFFVLSPGNCVRGEKSDFGKISLTARLTPLAKDSLFVAYSSHAEFSCHLVLGWALPERIIDLYFEFLRQINTTPRIPKPLGLRGRKRRCASLLRAMTYYGLDAISVGEKDHWRGIIETGGPWSEEEREGILDYCETDVDATARLLVAMLRRGHIDLPRALFRGRYAPALTRMQKVGCTDRPKTVRAFKEKRGVHQKTSPANPGRAVRRRVR